MSLDQVVLQHKSLVELVLGAGTIIIQKQAVKGLTTAAGLWATAGIGLAIGQECM